MRRNRKSIKAVTVMLIAAALLLVHSVDQSDRTRPPNPDSVRIRNIVQRPWMIQDQGRLMSESVLRITNSGEPFEAWVQIGVTGEQPYMQPVGSLLTGRNEVIVNVLELHKDGDKVTFAVYDNAEGKGKPYHVTTKPQQKIRRWKIYAAHDIHADIGYTHPQEQLNGNIFPGILDDAFRRIDETDSWAERDRFRYPIESSYMLYESAWNARNADWLETLKGRLKTGSMTYPSSYVNEVYGGLGTEELARIFYYSERHLKDRLGADSNKVLYMSDEPSFSWAAVDAMSEAGVRYLMLRQNPDPLDSYPKLFYYEGRNPINKVLACNYGHYSTDEFDFRNPDVESPFANITKQLMKHNAGAYPYDAVIADFATPHDNRGITAAVIKNVKALNKRTDRHGRDYVFPVFISSTVNDFFKYVESNYKENIPTYRGNMESWWNYGVSSASYETAVNRENHDKLPAAEMFAALASALAPNVKYPYERLSKAYNHMILFDEHTWGNAVPQPDGQWKWKRNHAIAAGRLADQVMEASLAALSGIIPAAGRTIAVFNPHAWERSDVVTVRQSELPAHFELTDAETGETVPHQKLEDGTVAFVAENVPGVGYKTFTVTPRKDDPFFETGITVSGSTMENAFFKITFAESGAIKSIVDKRNGNAEMVDDSAPYKLNEFVYFTTKKMGYDVISSHTINRSKLSAGTAGPVMTAMTADGVTEGVSSMKRKVLLYESLPRIDIINEVVKTEAPSYALQDEEAFFVFPLHVPNFLLRHEMPAGDVRPYVNPDIENPDNEQFYGSSTAYYTVNRWIDASDRSGYGITLSPVSNPIVQYGERRSALGDRGYNTAKPWIYSFVFNNKWHTNFQKTQPGPVTFKYSLTSHTGGDWKTGRADRFGMEAANGLKAYVIADAQPGSGLNAAKGQFIAIESGNVALTAVKLAEANGEGVMLRFNETLGRNTRVTVDLGILNPMAVTETDLVENDRVPVPIDNGRVTFEIDGYGWKTLRVVGGGKAPGSAGGAKAIKDAAGTLITWDELREDGIAYYEVFRGTDADFEPGTGTYLTSVSVNRAFDPQVTTESRLAYYYKIRAVKSGRKGYASDAVMATEGAIEDAQPPSVPDGFEAAALHGTRVSLSWEPSSDNVSVKGYKLYRNNVEIKDVGAHYNSYLDTETRGGEEYEYAVAAYDVKGNISERSRPVEAATPDDASSDGNIASLAAVTASSEYSAEYHDANAIDGIVGEHGSGEWASGGERHPWLQLEWDEPKDIEKIRLFDRVNLQDDAKEGVLTFSDGSSIEVTGIPGDGTVKEITFDAKTATWVRFEALGGIGSNVGLSEIQAFERFR